jgi:hypothetical protein
VDIVQHWHETARSRMTLEADMRGPFCRAAHTAPANDMVRCGLRREDAMRRRAFITLIGTTVAAWPLSVRAGQSYQPTQHLWRW